MIPSPSLHRRPSQINRLKRRGGKVYRAQDRFHLFYYLGRLGALRVAIFVYAGESKKSAGTRLAQRVPAPPSMASKCPSMGNTNLSTYSGPFQDYCSHVPAPPGRSRTCRGVKCGTAARRNTVHVFPGASCALYPFRDGPRSMRAGCGQLDMPPVLRRIVSQASRSAAGDGGAYMRSATAERLAASARTSRMWAR